MFNFLSHNRYVCKNIIFDQCIFSFFLISLFPIFLLSQLYGLKSNKPKNTHYCVTALADLGYKWLKNGWIFFALILSLSIVAQTWSPDILPHPTNNLRDLDLIDHSIGNWSVTHSPDQIKLSGGSSPILGVSNGWVWDGQLDWVYKTHLPIYYPYN